MQGLFNATVGGSVGLGNWLGGIVRADAGFNASTQVDRSAARDQVINSALSVSQNEDFQKNLQRVNDFSESKAFTNLKDEGVRLSSGYNNSLDELRTHQESYQIAKSNLDQISETTAWSEQNSQLIKKSLNQDFVDWGSERLGGFSQFQEFLSNGTEIERQSLITDFVGYVRSQENEGFSSFIPKNYQDPDTAYKNFPVKTINVEDEKNELYSSAVKDAVSAGLFKDEIKDSGSNLYSQKQIQEDYYNERSGLVNDKIKQQHEKMTRQGGRDQDRHRALAQAGSFGQGHGHPRPRQHRRQRSECRRARRDRRPHCHPHRRHHRLRQSDEHAARTNCQQERLAARSGNRHRRPRAIGDRHGRPRLAIRRHGRRQTLH